MKHKVSELTGQTLDAAVAFALGHSVVDLGLVVEGAPVVSLPEAGEANYIWRPSTDWSQAGPIIEREAITLCCGAAADRAWQAWVGPVWASDMDMRVDGEGPTPLIAAMRAFVFSKFGEEVDLPWA